MRECSIYAMRYNRSPTQHCQCGRARILVSFLITFQRNKTKNSSLVTGGQDFYSSKPCSNGSIVQPGFHRCHVDEINAMYFRGFELKLTYLLPQVSQSWVRWTPSRKCNCASIASFSKESEITSKQISK